MEWTNTIYDYLPVERIRIAPSIASFKHSSNLGFVLAHFLKDEAKTKLRNSTYNVLLVLKEIYECPNIKGKEP